MKEIFTLGMYETADEKQGVLISPALGMFTADGFNPESWSPSFRNAPFENMTEQDAFWATRIILSFTEPELRKIVETGQYTNPRDAEYVLQTLLERRRLVAHHWLSKINPISSFGIQPGEEGLVLRFRDLIAECGCAESAPVHYVYQVAGKQYKSLKQTTRSPGIELDRDTLSAAIEHGGPDMPIEVTIWTNRPGMSSDPVKVYFYWSPGRDKLSVHRIVRG